MTPTTLYYRARDQALANGRNHHLAAVLWRKRKPVRIGTNRNKTHPRAVRTFEDNSQAACLHAEMDALIAAQPGDTLEVLRWLKDGRLTMAKPCEHCQKWIRESRIRKVRYTNWEGQWETLTL